MDSPDIKLCMGCMREKQGKEAVCPFCGFDVNTPHHPLYLKPGTLVSKQYIVGKLIAYNGEGATYLGCDLTQNNKVLIREYMPDALAVRETGGEHVITLKGKETQYKALLSDFSDLCRQLQKLRTYTGLLSLTDFFEQNNTVYAVYQFVAETTLSSFFKENGVLTIETLKERLAPILAAVEAMHALGVIHRGISPETILVNEDRTLRLFGFSIPAARTAKCELAAELFAGYSPPELYSLTGWQGTWTDVYSVAAVIYTALTGVVPPEAPARLTGDTLKPASEVNPAVPEFISLVLQQAMALEPKERPQTIGAFSMALTQPAAPGGVMTENSDKRGENMYQEQPAKRKSAHKWKVRKRNFIYMMSSMLITTAVLLTLMFVILSEIDSSLLVFAKDNTPGTSIIDVSSDATASEAPYLLPDFVGSYLDSVKSKEDFQKKYFLTETEEYNDEQPAGVIFEQNPIANTPVTDSVNVAVKVSKGPAPIPDTIVGMAQADAQKTLDDLKIKYQVVQMYDDTVPAGNVIKVTRLPGEVMLFISQGSMNGASTGSGGYGGMTFEEYWKIFGTNSN
ncbi:protein kinase domain-containing protein [Acetanaerobacterium elongatum]|uniref:Serine/threonine protein kinase n=1 Tax=Acetanaerobacterium elongatum TaxID=258515 RepID=A0A1G9WHA2_9FIRM|nr:PASTA domain-containing protein [Acetanaerobacterium elongatum]SDM83435.1 serine/threonine protein kinase [Acetanaerobacterium elongatum]